MLVSRSGTAKLQDHGIMIINNPRAHLEGFSKVIQYILCTIMIAVTFFNQLYSNLAKGFLCSSITVFINAFYTVFDIVSKLTLKTRIIGKNGHLFSFDKIV